MQVTALEKAERRVLRVAQPWLVYADMLYPHGYFDGHKCEFEMMRAVRAYLKLKAKSRLPESVISATTGRVLKREMARLRPRKVSEIDDNASVPW